MKKGIFNIIGSIVLVGVMFFMVFQFQRLGNMFYEMRSSEAVQISALVKDNYDGIKTLNAKEKDNIIELYTDTELIGVDIRTLTGIMISSIYFFLGVIALCNFSLGVYQIYRHNKSNQQGPSAGTR